MSEDPFVATMQECIDVLMRTSMQSFLLHARETGLSMSHLGAIFHLHQSGSCGVTEIGDHLGVTSAAASQLLERLVRQGLIVRAEDPEDRRVKRIELTEAGQEILAQGLQARRGWLENLAASLSESEKQNLVENLELLIGKIDRLAQAADPVQ